MRSYTFIAAAFIATAGASQAQMMPRPTNQANPQAQAQALIHTGFPLGFFQLPSAGGIQPFSFAPLMSVNSGFAGMPWQHAYTSPYTTNPYLMNPYMPYMSPNTYSSSAMYSNQYMPSYSSGMTSSYAASSADAAKLLGVPVEKGRIQWPLGLRVLPPATETTTLRQQLDALLPTVAAQAASGQASPALVQQGVDAVHDFRKLLHPREGTMAEVTYTDAMRFLNRVERGLTQLQATNATAGNRAGY